MDPTTTPPEKFFCFNFTMENGVPKFSVKLKQEFKTKPAPKRPDGRPISPSVEGYFTHYLGNADGVLAYSFYREFFNKRTALDYGLENGMIDPSVAPAIQRYFEEIDDKTKANHAAIVATEEYRAKLKRAANKEANSTARKKWWSVDANRQRMNKVLNDPNITKKRVDGYSRWLNSGGREVLISACNKPERLEKISNASKRMWAEARSANNIAKLDKWFRGRYVKKHVFNNVRMNKPEFELAKILTGHGLKFSYEPAINIQSTIFYPDFVVDDIVFECYGDYWHANPRTYTPDEKIYADVTAKMIWERDQARQDLFQEAGYRVVIFWESEILCAEQEVNSRIEKELNDTRNKNRNS